MKVYTDKKGISHEETLEFDEKDPRDVATKKWFDEGLNPPTTTNREGVREANKIIRQINMIMGEWLSTVKSPRVHREFHQEWENLGEIKE